MEFINDLLPNLEPEVQDAEEGEVQHPLLKYKTHQHIQKPFISMLNLSRL